MLISYFLYNLGDQKEMKAMKVYKKEMPEMKRWKLVIMETKLYVSRKKLAERKIKLKRKIQKGRKCKRTVK